MFQQWCGINVIFNYAEEIFAAAGYGVSDILFNIVVTGSVNLVFTFVGLWLIDRLGRKPLMLAGSAGLAVAFGLIGDELRRPQPSESTCFCSSWWPSPATRCRWRR